ncbi:MAG: cupin domain-containing protein [Proteobacteria bacterium]|nr:cupin domain-containing protein [Pseudomonadota bacterium]
MATHAKLITPALDPETVAVRVGTTYPEPFKLGVEARQKRVIGDALGLSQFGVNTVRLTAGVMSSQRHWHSHEDEFVMVLEGELVLVTDAGEQVLGPGMAAGFPAGSGDGHHLINRTDSDAVYLEVGGRDGQDDVDYPDIDMIRRTRGGTKVFLHKDETPY